MGTFHYRFASITFAKTAMMVSALLVFGCDTESQTRSSGWKVKYAAPDHQYYATSPGARKELQTEIDHKDLSAIRKHGWQIWGAITKQTDQTYEPGEKSCGVSNKVAVFDTWWGEEEIFRTPVFCPDGKPCAENIKPRNNWHGPRQAGGAQVLSFNKYSVEFMDWVTDHDLYKASTLIGFNKALDKKGAAIKNRTIDQFVPSPLPTATMLKPTYWVLKADEPAMMPYWTGPLHPVSNNNSDTPRHPVVNTWKNFVLWDPTGKADPTKPREVTIYGINGPEKRMVAPKKVVGPDDFYGLPLSQADVTFIKGGNVFTIGGVPVSEIKPCDLAVLVGMHVTTAEVPNWTWQTFYWNPFPSDTTQPTVTGAFKNFDMATAYFFMGKNGEAHIAYNPYLEPPITGPTFMNPMTMHGADSNCMTCHHAAGFPTINKDPNPAVMLLGSYVSKGPISGGEQWFADRLKTTFMWGLTMSVQAKTGADRVAAPTDNQ